MNKGNDDGKTIEELQKDKARYEADKARLDAEKARVESQQALELAETSTAVTKLVKQKALADAEKALLESQKALITSQKLADIHNKKALADAEKALTDSQKALALAGNPSTKELGALEQQKALADAQKALADAQNQATLAKHIGTTKAGSYHGSVEMKDKAGAVESKLLAAHAVRKAAGKIANGVLEEAKNKCRIFIFEVEHFPDFQELLSFLFRLQLIERGFEAAGIPKYLPEEQIESVPALVSAGLEAVSNILGFLKTDYTVGGMDVGLDNSMLTFSVAGALAAKNSTWEVRIPSICKTNTIDEAEDAFNIKLREFGDMRRRAAEKVAQLKDDIAGLKQQAESKDGEEQDELIRQADNKEADRTVITSVIESFDTFLSSLTTADANGNIPLTNLVEEFAIDKAIGDVGTNGVILLLRLDNSGGGYLLKKNLWTGLFAMPLYHMGGATATYLLLDGSKGTVIQGDVIPVHGGFVRSDKISDTLGTP